MDTNLTRKAARVIAILAVALGAGQLMQSLSNSDQAARVARSEIAQKAKDIEPLAAGVEPVLPPLLLISPNAETPRLPDDNLAETTETPVLPQTPASPVLPAPALAGVDPCAVALNLDIKANAMIGLTVIAPCHASERMVLKHAGLAITANTSATGTARAVLPALKSDGTVEILFKDGARVSNAIAVPEIASMRRFAVQWQADDAFVIHAFEDGSSYGSLGDISPANLRNPASGLPAMGGFLTLLGDANTELPLLAQVYTFPSDPKAKVDVVVEAPVTKASCGHEILAETLFSAEGSVMVNDLTVAMPGCDAIGDYLVLKNLVPDMNIAAN